MRNRLQQALYELNEMERTSQQQSRLHAVDVRAQLTVVLIYLVCMLSLPLVNLSDLLLFSVYPMLACSVAAISYGRLFRRSLIVLPFVLFIGVFNPILDRQVVFFIGAIPVTRGWITLLSIVIRGLLSVQAVLLLVHSAGFYNLCRGLQRMGVPAIFTTQLLFVYRYLFVLIQEMLSLSRAREARSFGRRAHSIKVWGTIVSQLLIRTVDRAERIHQAMVARGFTGRIGGCVAVCRWQGRDTLFLVGWGALFVLLRLFHPIERISSCF